ncbi:MULTISPECIES: hypothetical protein [Hyphobacterium]|uniref:DUF4136 domain-containing protein n=1 Tax=Hyphobacterium vulgare TaxID=1736751 RepID=A0ABV6ZVW6_9PROT
MLSLVSALLLAASLNVQQASPQAADEIAGNFDDGVESPESWADGLVGSLIDIADIASPEGRITIDDPAGMADDLADIMSAIWPTLQQGDGNNGEFGLSFDLHAYAAGEARAGDEMCPAGSEGVAYEGPFEDAGPGTTVRVCRGFEETPEGDFYGQAIVLNNGPHEGVFIFTLLTTNDETAEPIADAGALISERLAASVRFTR